MAAEENSEELNRRPVASRQSGFFQKLAKRLVSVGLRPNQVSVASAVFAICAGLSIFAASRATSPATAMLCLILGLVGIQLRLICNLIDGLMAIEGGLKTPTGEIFNDYPDRISDIAILVGAGYAAATVYPWAVDLGWIAATAAVMTAYTRVLGASMKSPHFFAGPMAKQHRMFVMNLALIGSIVEYWMRQWGLALVIALALIAIGSVATCVRRLGLIARSLG
jgi:phosphatidylglycerophosphate synthase